jgi:glucokinase
VTVLAIDVGGTNLRAALVDSGTVRRRATRPTDPVEVGAAVEGLVAGLLGEHPDLAPGAVGIGLPEYVRDGRATSNEVVDWAAGDAARISRVVAAATGAEVAVVVEADVRCGAVAEHAALDRPDRESMLYVSWGTGLSSAFVLPGGQVWAGARGEALALGEWRDDTGNRLEAVTSGRGTEHAYRESTGCVLDAVAIHARALDGDVAAREIFQRAGRALGRAIRHLVHVLDPHVVVLGGGLGSSDHLARAALLAELGAGNGRPGFPPVQPARRGADAGLLGAAIVADRVARPHAPC